MENAKLNADGFGIGWNSYENGNKFFGQRKDGVNHGIARFIWKKENYKTHSSWVQSKETDELSLKNW